MTGGPEIPGYSPKPSPTFVYAIALVRRHLWLTSEGFSRLGVESDTHSSRSVPSTHRVPCLRHLKMRKVQLRWEIHLEPDSNAAVAVVLPVTTDCNATGAVCASDGRKLSNRNELSVSGPGG